MSERWCGLARRGEQLQLGSVKATSVRAALAVLLVLNLMWGSSLPATKLGLVEWSPFVLSWLRLTVSSALFLGVLLLGKELQSLRPRDWLSLAGLGVIGYGGTIGLQTLGTSATSGASAAVLGSTGPLFITLSAWVLLRERIARRTVVGLPVALLGVALVMGMSPAGDPANGLALLSSQHLIGDLLVLASAGCFGVFAVLGKNTMERCSPLAVSGISCLGGALVLAPPAFWEVAVSPSQPTVLGWAVVAHLGVVVTFVGMLAWFWALRIVPASRGGAFLFLQPLSGIALAALLLGDVLSPSFLVGSVFVLVGLFIAAGE